MIETVIRLERTSIACPSQWDAVTDKGNAIYFRYRGGNFSITLTDDPELSQRFPEWGDWIELHDENIGDWLDGWMSDNELFEKAPDWIAFSEEVRANATPDGTYFNGPGSDEILAEKPARAHDPGPGSAAAGDGPGVGGEPLPVR